ncbi:glycopeptide antibiotics resistance protein [Frigoribacterium sp. PhB107]|uniref:VanZ family protein n=1 Tax=Frigoribacterium sp. PhB107 TaxID=2485172 RepID=UPI000F48122A|nr:VanZ family protein [Frigoribacterium sp. PhB107]ROP72980.1 glycopeptide antibiotics resistance protein [Frigoribacterium sp. PhB107]
MFAASSPVVLPALATVVPVTIVAVALVGLRSRRAGADVGTTLWRTSFVAYLGALVAVTFFPFVIDLDAPPDSPWRPMMNLDALSSLHLRSFWLNIVMTVPLGAYLTGRGLAARGRARPGPAGRRRLRGIVPVAAIALVASVSVELLQLVLHLTIGGNRATDIDDVIANTAGAVVGAVLWRAVLRVGCRVLSGRRLELAATGANTSANTSANMRTTSSPQEAVLATAGPSRRRPHPSEPRTPARASEGARGS